MNGEAGTAQEGYTNILVSMDSFTRRRWAHPPKTRSVRETRAAFAAMMKDTEAIWGGRERASERVRG